MTINTASPPPPAVDDDGNGNAGMIMTIKFKELSLRSTISKIQSEVCPDMSIESDAVEYLHLSCHDLFVRLVNDSLCGGDGNPLCIADGAKVTVEMVQACLLRHLHIGIAHWAFHEAQQRVEYFRVKKKLPMPGMSFPLKPVIDHVRPIFETDAVLFMAASIEYIIADIIQASGILAQTASLNIIHTRHVIHTTSEDELKTLIPMRKESMFSTHLLKPAVTKKKSKSLTSKNSMVTKSVMRALKGQDSLSGTSESSNEIVDDGKEIPSTEHSSLISKSKHKNSRSLVLPTIIVSNTPGLLANVGSMLSDTNDRYGDNDDIDDSNFKRRKSRRLSGSELIKDSREMMKTGRNMGRLSGKSDIRINEICQNVVVLRPPCWIIKRHAYDDETGIKQHHNLQEVYPLSPMILLNVWLPGGEWAKVSVATQMTMREVLVYVCRRRNLNMNCYMLKYKDKDDVIQMTSSLGQLNIYDVRLARIFAGCDEDDHLYFYNENSTDVIVSHKMNGVFVIKAATEEKLIERVADEHAVDSHFASSLLLTFRSFVSPCEFLKKLLARYNVVCPKNATEEEQLYFDKWKRPIQYKVIRFLQRWIEDYFQDFYQNSELLQQLMDMTEHFIKDDFEMETIALCQAIKVSLKVWEATELTLLPLDKSAMLEECVTNPTRCFDNVMRSELEVSVATLNPIMMAQQISLHIHTLFNQILPIEYIHYVWNAEQAGDLCPNLNILISRWNFESYWVASEICTESNMAIRAQLIGIFIQTAHHCLELCNLFSVFSIISGLSLSCVTRMKRSWDLVPSKLKNQLSVMETLMDPSRNMKRYRECARSFQPPILPVLPISLKDLYFINDGNKKYAYGNLINFEKLSMMADLVKTVRSNYIVSFNTTDFLPCSDNILRYLKDPDAIVNISLLTHHSIRNESPKIKMDSGCKLHSISKSARYPQRRKV